MLYFFYLKIPGPTKCHSFYFILIALLTPLLFLDLPITTKYRSINSLFDLGHVAFFALVVQILPTENKNYLYSHYWILKTLSIVLFFGLFIEFIQFYLDNRI